MKYLLTITLSSLISITSFSATLPGNEGSININYPNNRCPLANVCKIRENKNKENPCNY